MLKYLLLLCSIPVVYNKNPKIWGSSVVTDIDGPSPLLRYITPAAPYVKLDGTSLKIENGSCFSSVHEVGRPCSITAVPDGFLTEIQLPSVRSHKQILVSGQVWHTTFFAPNCTFPKALEGNSNFIIIILISIILMISPKIGLIFNKM
uniref:Uncharacterized protein n=1 Tax=Schistocephalus solidus TaxID=70667 RepID=A0A0V0J9B5_SCHSO